MENIKRKAATSRKLPVTLPGSSFTQGPTVEYIRTIESLQAQVDHLTRAHDDITERLRNVETNYKEVLNEMVNFQRGLGQHDMLVQNLIQHFLQVDQTMGASRMAQNILPVQDTTSTSPFFENPNTANPFFPEESGATLSVNDFMTDVSGGPLNIDPSKDEPSFNLRTMEALPRPDSVLTRFITSGMLPTPSTDPSPELSLNAMPGDLASQKSDTTTPWSTTPRVLVVEHEQASRNLCSRHLQDHGCSVDLAFDGASAVNKMNIEEFDLVLMVRLVLPLAHFRPDHCQQDITIPKLDGCSAASMIRRFNRDTPIIAVTSDAKPSQIMSYFTAGMSDVLEKPLVKAEISEILEVCRIYLLSFPSVDRTIEQKHLAHLKSTSVRTSSQSSTQYSTMDKSSGLPVIIPLKRPWEEASATVGNSILEKRGRY